MLSAGDCDHIVKVSFTKEHEIKIIGYYCQSVNVKNAWFHTAATAPAASSNTTQLKSGQK